MQLIIRFKGNTAKIELPDDSKVSQLMEKISQELSVSAENQKIICTGKNITDPDALLSSYNLKNGSKILLMEKSKMETTKTPNPPPTRTSFFTQQPQPEFLNSPPHDKIIAQGVPENCEKPFPSQMMVLPKTPFIVYNTEGKLSKLSFESDAIWVESNDEKQERIFYSDVKTYLVQEIPGYENKYVGLCLHTKYGKRWYYFIPNQYVAIMKKVFVP